MSNRYADLRHNLGRPLFIPFTVLGDPDLKKSLEIVETLIASGADALELGLPFSDPPADGPVIQAADVRALSAHVHVDDCFQIIREVRKKHDLPIGLLVYFNLVLQRGIEQFYTECGELGVDSVLIADLPLEHADEVLGAAKANSVHQVFLVSELTDDARLTKICAVSGGYLYLVSYLGVTGANAGGIGERVHPLIERVRKHTDLPLFVGFGVQDAQGAKAIAQAGADGVIVGSRIVKEVPDVGRISILCREFAVTFAST